MATLNREQILSAQDIERRLVSVPEWGGEVWIAGLTGTDRDAFEAEMFNLKVNRNGRGRNGTTTTEINLNKVAIRAGLLSRTIVDENGIKLFTADDVKALGEKSAKALDRCYEVAQQLSGITEEDAKEIEGN